MSFYQNKFLHVMIMMVLILIVFHLTLKAYMDFQRLKIDKGRLVLEAHVTRLNHKAVTGQDKPISADPNNLNAGKLGADPENSLFTAQPGQ